ncbi:CHAT domain-containing protein [Scytonema hofmannii]|uniref:CHAT domain-containing protein n=1 Tax=Scytonema hofmannii TaxID=34078 RepID=UPI0003725C6B|nr:CHAT domain-containing protein [Scytonema hofmannii]
MKCKRIQSILVLANGIRSYTSKTHLRGFQNLNFSRVRVGGLNLYSREFYSLAPFLRKIILVATLSFILSFNIPTLFSATAQQPVVIQQSAIALLQAGKKSYDEGLFAEAIQTLQQAAKIYAARGETLNQAQTLSFLSLAQQKLGQFQEAEQAISTSLFLLKDLPDNKDITQIRALVLNAQAHLQFVKGNAETALETWQNTEKLYSQIRDRTGIIGSKINQTLALQVLGLYRRADKIITQIEQEIYKEPDPSFKVAGLLNIGQIRRQGRDLEQSQKILKMGLEVAQKMRSPEVQSKVLLSLGNTESALARNAKVSKNLKNAQNYTQKALNSYQQAANIAISPQTKIQANLNQLSVLLENRQYSSLPVLLPQIRISLEKLPKSRASIYARVNFAQNLIKWSLDRKENITQILNIAIEQARNLTDKRAESYALGTLGEVYEKTSDWAKAIEFTRSALVIAQAINAPDIAYRWQWQMGRLLQMQAEKTHHNKNTDTKAVSYYTQAFNTLNNLRGDLVVLNPEVQFSFRETVEPVYRQLVDLLLRDLNPNRDRLIQARDVMEALQLAELDNFFGDACAKPEKVKIDDLDPHAAVIYPIILPDRLEVVIKLPGTDNLRHYGNQNVSDTQVDEAVKRLRQSLKRRSTSPNQIKKEAQQIYDWLIKPFEAELENTKNREESQIKNLVFVLDGSLRNLPMAVLHNGTRYLIERYAVSVTSGLQLLEPKPLLRESLRVLVGGAIDAPSFEKEGLGAINNVAVELEGVKKNVQRTQMLENQTFLQQNIQKQINSNPYNIVHLATHGKFSSNPEQTFILDWQKRIKVKDFDSLLNLDYQRSSKPIELLILSACETATGDNRAALGLAGVAIKAGARSTLASLWQVNDASTAQFMIKFYQELKNPQVTKAEALRNAQRAFLKEFSSTDYNRPYHWASFILVGNWF